jgi:hypothetical protein
MKGVVITVTNDEQWLIWTGRQKEVLDRLRATGAEMAQGKRRVKGSDTMGS